MFSMTDATGPPSTSDRPRASKLDPKCRLDTSLLMRPGAKEKFRLMVDMCLSFRYFIRLLARHFRTPATPEDRV